MYPGRALRALRAVMALSAAFVLALAATAHAGDTGPPLSVPPADLAAALDCPKPLAGASRAPVDGRQARGRQGRADDAPLPRLRLAAASSLERGIERHGRRQQR